jgi:hypothetical protein
MELWGFERRFGGEIVYCRRLAVQPRLFVPIVLADSLLYFVGNRQKLGEKPKRGSL